MRSRQLALALAALMAAVGQAADVAAPLPAPVAAALKSIADQCREVGGKPLTRDAVRHADLNGDGKEDFVIDVGAVNCDGAAGIYGDREKAVSVYAADGKGGASLVFSDAVYGVKLEGKGVAAKLWLTVPGARCGKPAARDFASENFCDRALVWNDRTSKFDYASIATVRMIR